MSKKLSLLNTAKYPSDKSVLCHENCYTVRWTYYEHFCGKLFCKGVVGSGYE